MKIVVAILTREMPVGLITMVGALHILASGAHDVTYVVWCDSDDVSTVEAVARLAENVPNVLSIVGTRPLAPAAGWNAALRAAEPWDVATTLNDDMVPLTEWWDLRLINTISRDQPVVSWAQTCEPTEPNFPVVSGCWFEALGHSLYPEIFPFWFGDTWIREVHELATGRVLPLVHGLWLGGRHRPTRNMRDLAFWFRVFAATRPLRVAEADSVISALGLSMPDRSTALAAMTEVDARQLDRVPYYEEEFMGSVTEPSVSYLILKREAGRYLS